MEFKSARQRKYVMSLVDAAGRAKAAGKKVFKKGKETFHEIGPDSWEPESMFKRK